MDLRLSSDLHMDTTTHTWHCEPTHSHTELKRDKLLGLENKVGNKHDQDAEGVNATLAVGGMKKQGALESVQRGSMEQELFNSIYSHASSPGEVVGIRFTYEPWK